MATLLIVVSAFLALGNVSHYLRGKRIKSLLAALHEGPLCYAACDENGGDVIWCPLCAWSVPWSGRRPSPIYAGEIDEEWGGFDGLTCHKCGRAIESAKGAWRP